MITDSPKDRLQKISSCDLCGKGTILRLNFDNLRIVAFPIRCKSWHCPRCSPRLAEMWRQRIADAKPERFITLTWDTRNGCSPPKALILMKAAFARLVRLLRKEHFKFEYCAIWEFTRKGFPHIHIAQKGSYIPQKELSAMWASLGAGPVVDIRKILSFPAIARELTKYLLKSASSSVVTLGKFRLIQASKGFFEPNLITRPPSSYGGGKSFRVPFSLPFVIGTIEHYFSYAMISMTNTYIVQMAPRPLTDYNFIIPDGFEDLGNLLRERRRPTMLDPPQEFLTLAQLSQLWGL